MKEIYEFIKSFDMHTIIVVGIAFWWVNGNITSLDDKVNKLSERVARMEGMLINREFTRDLTSKK